MRGEKKLIADDQSKAINTKKNLNETVLCFFINWWPMLFALLIIVAAIALYFLQLGAPLYDECIGRWDEAKCISSQLSDDRSAWGQFGDFIGGTVNPLIGFLTIILLLTTIRQQNAAIKQTETALNQAGKSLEHAEQALVQNEEALKITREEIRIAREEISLSRAINAKTEEALSAQINISRSQNYLSNYFEHRNQYTEYINSNFKDDELKKYKIFPRSFHSFGYPKASDGDLKLRVDLLRSLHEDLVELVGFLRGLEDNFDETRLEFSTLLTVLAMGRYRLYRGYVFLVHRSINKQSGWVFSNGVNIDTSFIEVKNGFREFIDHSNVIQRMIAFDGDFIGMRFRTALDLLEDLQRKYPILSFQEHNNLLFDFDEFIVQRELSLPALQNDLDDINDALRELN